MFAAFCRIFFGEKSGEKYFRRFLQSFAAFCRKIFGEKRRNFAGIGEKCFRRFLQSFAAFRRNFFGEKRRNFAGSGEKCPTCMWDIFYYFFVGFWVPKWAHVGHFLILLCWILNPQVGPCGTFLITFFVAFWVPKWAHVGLFLLLFC